VLGQRGGPDPQSQGEGSGRGPWEGPSGRRLSGDASGSPPDYCLAMGGEEGSLSTFFLASHLFGNLLVTDQISRKPVSHYPPPVTLKIKAKNLSSKKTSQSL